MECTPRTCSLGAKCGNRRLQRWKGGGIDVRDCGDARGFGLFACRNFKAGSLIGEYVGEVMRARNYAQLRRERKEKHWYFMALDKEEVVDASRRGGLTRFLNHSCEPNAECQSWTVDGEKRIAIVAQRPIAADEEVTFDYSWKGALQCPFPSRRRRTGRARRHRRDRSDAVVVIRASARRASVVSRRYHQRRRPGEVREAGLVQDLDEVLLRRQEV